MVEKGFTSPVTLELDDNFDMSSISLQLEGKLGLQSGYLYDHRSNGMSREKLIRWNLESKKTNKRLHKEGYST